MSYASYEQEHSDQVVFERLKAQQTSPSVRLPGELPSVTHVALNLAIDLDNDQSGDI